MARGSRPTALLQPSRIYLGAMTISYQTFSGGTGGIVIDKLSTDTSNDPGITWTIDGTRKYEIGMDASNSDFALIYDLSIPGDTARCSAGGKWIFGTGVGSPSAETSVFTIDGTTGSQALHPLTMKISNNNEWGCIVRNSATGTAAASFFSAQADTGAGAGTGRMEMYGTAHSTNANQFWVFAGGANTPMILGTSGAERWRIDQTTGTLKAATAGIGLAIKEGSNATMGVVTLSGAGASAIVYSTAFTANSRVFAIHQNALPNVASTGAVLMTASSNLVQFTLASSNTADRSVVAWWIIQQS